MGAPKADTSAGSNVGSAYAFYYDGSGWVQEQKLTPSDGAAYDEFGTAVAIDGDTVVIGSPFDDDRGSASGSAYVFRFQGSSWVQTQKLLASDGAAADGFGCALAIEGDTLVVGAHNDGNAAPAAGHGAAYVFRFNGSSWLEERKLLASDVGQGDKFGLSVAVSGDAVLVGAHLNRDFGSESGSAYVFRRSGSTWVQEQKLLPSDGAAYQSFGSSVALAGDLAVVGAFRDDTAGLNFGSAYIYRYSGSAWVEEAELVGSDTAQNDKFGWAVAAGADVVVIGASNAGRSYHTYNDGPGAVYQFRDNGSGWVEEQKLTASDGAFNNFLGSSVGLSGEMMVTGAPGHGHNVYGAGAAYVGVPSSCDPGGTDPPAASVTRAVSRKGCDLALFPAGVSESRQGGITQLHLEFDIAPGAPGGAPVSIEQATCSAPSFVPYSGGATVSSAVTGQTLVLTFAPGLESGRTYRLTPGPELTSIAGQSIEFRVLVGDVTSDGRVDGMDRSALIGAWTGGGFSCATDLNNDGRTDSVDRGVAIGAWTGATNCAP